MRRVKCEMFRTHCTSPLDETRGPEGRRRSNLGRADRAPSSPELYSTARNIVVTEGMARELARIAS